MVIFSGQFSYCNFEFKGESFVAIYISFNINLSQETIIDMCKGLHLKLCIHLSVFEFM